MNILSIRWLMALILWSVFSSNAVSNSSIVINPENIPDPAIPTIVGPVEFSATLVDESTVELSWNPTLLDGSQASYFNLWDKHTLIGTTTDSKWLFTGIDRNYHHDFAVSAVTTNGVETRRSSRIYYDLPQLDIDVPDGWNQYLPPLENLVAEVISEDSVKLSWDLPQTYWSWANPADYSYAIIVDNTYVDVVDDLEYTYNGLQGRGDVWIGVSALLRDTQSDQVVLSSRQPHRVLVDSSLAIGTVSNGVTGYSSVSGLRAEVYSSTAAELFWNVGYNDTSHVFINGVLIARIKSGHSLFIENLPPGERLLMSVGEGWPYDENPEYAFLLSYDSPLMHTYIELPDGAVPIADDPTPLVTGLYSEAYSSSAAEVFWNRSDAVLTRYRVYLNDEFLIETDAASWYFDNLLADTEYTVGIVAIEPAGPDGSQSGVLVETSFRTFTEYGKPIINCQIDGLYASVYSTTAAEIFWDRDVAGPRYDVYVNEGFLANTDATSWFIGGLEPGSDHLFKIQVADDMCAGDFYSVPFSLATQGDAPASNDSIINRGNHIEILNEVFRIYVGEYYTMPLSQASEFTITGRNPDSSFIDVFNCDSGSFDQELNPTPTNAGVFFTFTFDQCLLDDETRDGYVSGQDGARGLNFDTAEYSITQDSGDRFNYSGSFQQLRSQTLFFDQIHSFDTNGASVDVSMGGSDLVLLDMNTSFAYGDHTNGLDSAWLKGGFTLTSDAIGDSTFIVSTLVDLIYKLNTRTDGSIVDGIEPELAPVSSEQRNNWTFTSGQLQVTAEDGSQLLLDAYTGDPDTITITITSEQGSDAFVQDWSIWSDILRFEDYQDLTR